MTANQTPATVMIVWNGCDSYVEMDRAAERGLKIDGNQLHTARESFTAFPAVEIDFDSLPIVDGEVDTDGVFGSESGKYYRAA